MTATIQRHYSDVGTGQTEGPLDVNADGGSPTPTPNPNAYRSSDIKGRIQVIGFWHDVLGRETARAEYGNVLEDTDPFNRASIGSAPSTSANVLVTTTNYNEDGTVDYVTAPNDVKTRTLYDDLGRTTAEVGDYDGPMSSTDENYVWYAYVDGLLSAMRVDVDGDTVQDSDDQVTRYFYGTTVVSLPGSQVATGHLLRFAVYPDTANVGTQYSDFVSSDADVVSYHYNAQGEEIQRKDQDGNVVETAFDSFGRPLDKKVATVSSATGPAYDGAVRRISTLYDTLGRVSTVGQYDATSSGTLLDEVKYVYDGWGNLTAFQQDHDSAVGTGVSYDVSYTYQKATTGRNTIRRTSVTIPNSVSAPTETDYTYTYDSTDSHDDAASRVTTIQNAFTTDLVRYDYNGVGHVVRTTLPEPGIYSSLFGASGTAFTGLDQFNRPIGSQWTKDLGTDVHFFDVEVGWDDNSNVTFQDDNVLPGHDILYSNDALNRLTAADEGTLASGSISSRTRKQEWTLTRTGNWSVDKVDLDGDLNWSDAGELNDTRVHNDVNELESRNTNSTGGLEFEYDYDAVGNMTEDGASYKYEWDVFGRLRRVKNQAGALVSEYWYNGLGYRVRWHYDNRPAAGVDTDDRHYRFVYDERWRIVATYRQPDGAAADNQPKEQFVYHCAGGGGYGGSSYIDHVLLRDKDASTLWTATANGLDERIYFCQNWRADVVAIVDDSGTYLEGARYSAYGVPFGLPYGDVDGDGDCEADDIADVTEWDDLNQYDVRGDIDLDGDVDTDDVNAVTLNEDATHGRGTLSDRGLDNRKGYAGYECAGSIAHVYHVRHRVYDSILGRWLRRDPDFYSSYPNLYEFVDGAAIAKYDPTGLAGIGQGMYRAAMIKRASESKRSIGILPISEWPRYGNHCGKNHGDGLAHGGGPVVDGPNGLDVCCKEHDGCYKEKGCAYTPFCDEKTSECATCDSTICACAKRAIAPAAPVAVVQGLFCYCIEKVYFLGVFDVTGMCQSIWSLFE